MLAQRRNRTGQQSRSHLCMTSCLLLSPWVPASACNCWRWNPPHLWSDVGPAGAHSGTSLLLYLPESCSSSALRLWYVIPLTAGCAAQTLRHHPRSPANAIPSPKVGSMLARRRRRRANIEPTLGQCIAWDRSHTSIPITFRPAPGQRRMEFGDGPKYLAPPK